LKSINYSDSVDVRYIRTDKFTRNLISVNFIVPINENASKNALLCGVLRSGNKNYKDRTEINRFLEENYGATLASSVAKTGENQIVRLSCSFIADRFALDSTGVTDNMIKFFSGIITEPLIENGGFKKEYVDTERKNLIDRINRRINNKAGYAINKCISAMCEEEAFSIDELGDPELIAKITPNDLYEAYNELLSNSKVLVIGSGSLSEEQLLGFVAGIFKKDRKGSLGDTLFVEEAEDVTEITDELDINQSVLCMGFRTGAKDYSDNRFAYMMFNAVYGASPISYLFMNVREKLSLCYFCSSSLNMQKGIMVVYAGIAKENKKKAYDEILKQLDRIRNGDISDEDMDGALKMLINQYQTVTDELFSTDTYYLNSYIGGQEISADEFISGISAVTKDDIRKCAEKITLDTVYFLTSSENTVGEDK